jgi:hypothetical protein
MELTRIFRTDRLSFSTLGGMRNTIKQISYSDVHENRVQTGFRGYPKAGSNQPKTRFTGRWKTSQEKRSGWQIAGAMPPTKPHCNRSPVRSEKFLGVVITDEYSPD